MRLSIRLLSPVKINAALLLTKAGSTGLIIEELNNRDGIDTANRKKEI